MKLVFFKKSELRNQLVKKLVASFVENMPLYGQMLEIVHEVNAEELEKDPSRAAEIAQLGKVMHGAIRLATYEELSVVTRIFDVLGLKPFNYYDLRKGVAVHSTAFRPATDAEIKENGFRVFTSLLDIDAIPAQHHAWINSLIARRDLFSPRLRSLLAIAEKDGGLDHVQSDWFTTEVVGLLTRPFKAIITREEYEKALSIKETLAHILVSNACPLNHLTPCCANVHSVHRKMLERGIKAIPAVEGPPEGWSILLNQVSCTAPAVQLLFPDGKDSFEGGAHIESFVEVEQRHVALTHKGRNMYDACLAHAASLVKVDKKDPTYPAALQAAQEIAFAEFPKDFREMANLGLAYVTRNGDSLVYEDFLPKSAEGIFKSNFTHELKDAQAALPDNRMKFVEAVGGEICDMYDYYRKLTS